jgi:hypothetical protein
VKTLKFKDVGRDKRSFEMRVRHMYESGLANRIRSAAGLMSRDVDIEFDGNSGVVLVGGFRQVGTFTIEEAPNAADT